MSPCVEPIRHSPPFRATQYLYESALVSLSTLPFAELLTSINACVPHDAHVGWIRRLSAPKYPELPPRVSVPLAAHAPALAVHVHNDVDPPGYPVPTDAGHASVDIESPFVYVTPSPPEPIRDTYTVPLPPVSVIVHGVVIESVSVVL